MNMLEWIGERRYLLLLLALLGLFLVNPFLGGHQLALQVLLVVMLVGAVKAVSRTRNGFVAALLLVVPALGCNWALVLGYANPYLWWTGNLLMVAFLFYVIVMLLAHLIRAHRISADLIMGSACAYLLLGLVWNFLFTMVALADPEAFRGITLADLAAQPDAFLYFSYVTLTTLGYGDIVPVSALARALSCLLAILGQFYLAVLVARLVGLHMYSHADANADSSDTASAISSSNPE